MGKNRLQDGNSRKGFKIALHLLLLFLALGLVCSGPGISSSYAQEVMKLRVPVPKLAPVQTMTLRGAWGGYSFKLPIPARWEVEKATFHFSYVNSTALIAQNSRLIVLLNGRPLAQVTLQPLSPVGTVAVALPVRLLKPGYQDLEFMVTQHYTLDCEDPGAPELWTTLELDKAYLDFEFRYRKIPLQLKAAADFLFDPRSSSENRVHLVVEGLSPEMMDLAATVATGIAVRFDYRPVIFSISPTLKPGMDNVLLGDRKFVARVLGDQSPEVRSASLFIRPLPAPGEPSAGKREDPHHALLVVSGQNLEEVRRSAQTFASLTFPYPGTAGMEVKEISLPLVGVSQGRNMLTPGQKYSFQALGFDSYTFRGMKPASRSIDFRVPTHLMAKSNDFAWVTLHMAYGSGMRKDSVLNVFFNGKYISSIFLENPQGGTFENYRIPLPAYLMKRGLNNLTFTAVLTPLITGRCEFIQTENLLLTIFGDSGLQLPPMSSWVDLPRMELFFQDGFPFTRWPDGRESILLLTEKSWETAAAALNLLALSSQKIGYPTFRARIAFDPPKDGDGEILVVGPIPTVPEELLKAAPIRFSKEGWVPYPQLKRLEAQPAAGDSWIRRFWGRFFSFPGEEKTGGDVLAAPSSQVSGLGEEKVVLTQFQSPYKSGRSVLLLSAPLASELYKGSRALWDSGVQGRLVGDVAIVELKAPDYPAAVAEMGPKYYVGEGGSVSWLNAFVYSHPWLFLILLLLAFVVLALCGYYLLKKQRRKRMGYEGA